MRSFDFLMVNIHVQFEGMVYQQIVGIPMGTHCAPFKVNLFLFCYERDLMSNLHKSKRYDIIDMLNDTSRYLDDISPLITLNLRNVFLKYIHGTSVEQSKSFRQRNFFHWFKYDRYWQWCSYQRLRQTRWLRISYHQFSLVEWWCSYNPIVWCVHFSFG